MVHPLSIQNHLGALSCQTGAKDQKAALGHFQPLSIHSGEWLLTARSGHSTDSKIVKMTGRCPAKNCLTAESPNLVGEHSPPHVISTNHTAPLEIQYG